MLLHSFHTSMNSILPAGIESYLKEAGFSSTEMLILRKLVEEDSFTLRELAGKTGKSTGVLDQAMKKLLQKKIAKKEVMNGQPRYRIDSLEAIVRWMNDDMKQRKESLERRHENFESFIGSLKIDKHRPDMEYFQGIEGIQQAYLKLLESGKELLTYAPVLYPAEEDPLRSFRIDYFRKRQVRKIFQRVLAPDTTLARRFQSRDPFEFRKTLLVSESEYPMTFEKMIVGDTIACINFTEETACFLRYPDLAESERAHFESLWNRQLAGTPAVELPAAEIPLKTRVLSNIREFLLSRKSIVAFLVFALVAGGFTFWLYQSNRSINLQRMKDRVMAIAATGALQFDEKDLAVLKQEEDYKKPQWAKVNSQLKKIRLSNVDIIYTYLLRKTEADSAKLEFVGESDSTNPYANIDSDLTNDIDQNGDGKVDGSPTGGDYLSWPGQPYLDPPTESFDGFLEVTTNKDFYEDQWGRVITAYAPIKNQSGSTVAVLAVDMQASKLKDMTNKTFVPLYSFLVLFICFVLARLFAYR